jgi:subtilisin family serine protease
MHRRIAPLFLAVLIALPVVAPVSAAKPADSTAPSPASVPSTEPAPSADPVASAEPGVSATTDPGTGRAADAPSAAPSDASASPATTAGRSTAAGPSTAATAKPVKAGRPDATGRYIVMLRTGADPAAVVAKARKRDGVKSDRNFTKALRGFAAKLDKRQKADLLADPNVLALVPDEVIEMTQTVPTGVARVGGRINKIAAIDGTDRRVNADVAIVDTGIAYHADLNVAGGYNCSSADRTAWRDNNNHGTHVAGTVAALDNTIGVVGVAPGARVWGVKILNGDGYGLLSWYLCGLDWITAQRDPNDPSRPLFEAVNMSVTKTGSDDHNCGLTVRDPLHQAICRVVAAGITVVAAAANDHHNAAANIPASYDEVITVSALADTDGKPGGLGGNRCYSWGGYDKDDTFADFSNYGGDVDIIAPGKCIMSTIPGGYTYMSGTSMASPTVAGAVALYKSSRPNATPKEVREALRYLGNLNWAYWTDPDPSHEPLLEVSRIGPLGTFALKPAATTPTAEGGSTASIPVKIVRSPTFFERVYLRITSLPSGWTGTPVPASLLGWTANDGRLSVVIPKGTPVGPYTIGVTGTNQGRTVTTTVTVNVVEDNPTAARPTSSLIDGAWLGRADLRVRVSWPKATDPSSAIAGYEVESSRNGAAWTSTIARTAAQLEAGYTVNLNTSYRFRVRAVDTAGHWSPWVQSALSTRITIVDDRSAGVIRHGSWGRVTIPTAWSSTVTGARRAGATLSMTFTGHDIAVVGPKNPRLGWAKIYLDGRYITTISMWRATGASRQVAFTHHFASGGQHTIWFRVYGTSGRPLVQLDAFVIGR